MSAFLFKQTGPPTQTAHAGRGRSEREPARLGARAHWGASAGRGLSRPRARRAAGRGRGLARRRRAPRAGRSRRLGGPALGSRSGSRSGPVGAEAELSLLPGSVGAAAGARPPRGCRASRELTRRERCFLLLFCSSHRFCWMQDGFSWEFSALLCRSDFGGPSSAGPPWSQCFSPGPRESQALSPSKPSASVRESYSINALRE